jgi:hypothetical protein
MTVAEHRGSTAARDTEDGATSARACAHRHLVLGWWSLLAFLSLGIALETLHGFKIGWYLDVANETRRLMLTLGHAHGTLLSVLHIAFGATAHLRPAWPARSRDLASRALTGATVLLPGGFVLGGLITHGGDPGLGILLVPLGALLLLVAVVLTARGASTGR